MNPLHGVALLTLFGGVIASVGSQAQEKAAPVLTHTHNEFSLTVMASYEQAFPLFGAWEEKKWAEGFDPQFLHPAPAQDQQGMVFTTAHSGGTRVWMNTVFDSATGHVQYVYFADDSMVTLIDIHLTKAGSAETHISVVYERTALKSHANEEVAHHAKLDASNGPEWAAAINGYLAKSKAAATSSK